MKRACEHCGAEFEVVPGRTGGGLRRRFCTDNCRKRACEKRYRATCLDCGAELRAGSAWLGHEAYRCVPCWQAWIGEVVDERAQEIVKWWAEGLHQDEIAGRLGWTVNHLHVEMDRLRKKGYDLPLRHRPFDIPAIEQAWADGLSCRELAEQFGWKNRKSATNIISYLRLSRGADLPYRKKAAA